MHYRRHVGKQLTLESVGKFEKSSLCVVKSSAAEVQTKIQNARKTTVEIKPQSPTNPGTLYVWRSVHELAGKRTGLDELGNASTTTQPTPSVSNSTCCPDRSSRAAMSDTTSLRERPDSRTSHSLPILRGPSIHFWGYVLTSSRTSRGPGSTFGGSSGDSEGAFDKYETVY